MELQSITIDFLSFPTIGCAFLLPLRLYRLLALSRQSFLALELLVKQILVSHLYLDISESLLGEKEIATHVLCVSRVPERLSNC
jgi:hypothetical protein